MVIHEAGNYQVEKLAEKQYTIFYEDKYEVKIVGRYRNVANAVKKAEQLNKKG